MAAYYNEFDPYAAQWLRNLIAKNLIPRGEVDERSITEVHPDDLRGFRQCHFFAGIGGWALAARLAGWPDDRELWTGSPPCQPFSVAGKGKAQGDDRHLWPHYFRLIRARRPAVVMGEQVAAAIGHAWLDGVIADLEGEGYAGRAVVVPACAVNAPHRRDRLWFVARAIAVGARISAGLEGHAGNDNDPPGRPQPDRSVAAAGGSSIVADADGEPGGQGCAVEGGCNQGSDAQPRAGSFGGSTGFDGAVPDTEGFGQREQDDQDPPVAAGRQARPVPVERGHWDGAGWVIGHDGKARRVGTSFRRMVDGFSTGVGGLRSDHHAKALAEVIVYGQEANAGPAEILRAVWDRVLSEPAAYGAMGEQAGVCRAEVLLAFLCQLDRSCGESHLPLPGSEELRAAMRGVRDRAGHARASCGRGRVEQRSVQHPDSLQALSFVLAQHAEAAWAAYRQANAAPMELLAHGVPARVGRLRAYGNAIAPPLAAEVIGAYLDCHP